MSIAGVGPWHGPESPSPRGSRPPIAFTNSGHARSISLTIVLASAASPAFVDWYQTDTFLLEVVRYDQLASILMSTPHTTKFAFVRGPEVFGSAMVLPCSRRSSQLPS